MGTYTPTNTPSWPKEPRLGKPQNFSQTTASTFELAAAVTGKKQRLISAELYISGAQTLTFKSGSDTILGGVFEIGGAGTATIGVQYGHFIESTTSAALNLTTAQAVTVKGPIQIVEV